MKELDDFYLCQRKQEAFGAASALFNYRFQNDNGSVPQLEQARLYCDRWKQMQQENLGLLFWGTPGNGKTFAAAAIANFLLEQEGWHAPKVKMTTFGTILGKLPGMSAQDKEWYLKDFQTCDLLILDDFGMERQTDYAKEQIFNIIDNRYLARLPLIVTTNLSLQELKHPGSMVDQRIFDRVLEMCVPICFNGESLRQQKAKEKLRLYKKLTSE
jgi:DNA replication protein DnaC